MTGDMIYVMVHREERGGMMIEERSDMVIPTKSFQQETNHLSGYYLPYLIRNLTKLTSNVCKGILDYFQREVNKVNEHQLFGERLQ